MSALEIVVIIIAVAIVLSVVIASIVRKVKGKPSISSECCGCPYSGSCDHNCSHGSNKQA